MKQAALFYPSNLPTIISQNQFKEIWMRNDEVTARTKQWIARETASSSKSSILLSIIDEMVSNDDGDGQ